MEVAFQLYSFHCFVAGRTPCLKAVLAMQNREGPFKHRLSRRQGLETLLFHACCLRDIRDTAIRVGYYSNQP